MPALGGVYKLAAIIDSEGNITPKIKLSNNTAKITNPGFKNIYRVYDKSTGKAEADVIYLRGEKEIDTTKPLVLTHPTERWKKTTYENYEVKSLHVEVIKDGKLVYDMPSLKEIKEYAKLELESFWDEYKRLDRPHLYKVDLSDDLYELKRTMLDKIRGNKENA
jgi:nicotinate phosphoribosyltransferase